MIWRITNGSQFQKQWWISIRKNKIYLETKFFPNWRGVVFSWPFWIQNGRHGKPKWLPYGAVCLTPCKYSFPLKSFHFWIFNNLFWFYIGSHLENFKNKEHNFEWWSIFFIRFQKDSLYGVNLTFFAPWLPWQRPLFWIFSTPPKAATH